MHRESFLGFVVLGCFFLNPPSVLAEDTALQKSASAPKRIVTDRNGVVLDTTALALGYLRLNKIAGDDPLQLSLDVNSNRVLDEELAAGVEKYAAKGAAGFIMDVNTGEIIALSSIESPSLQRQATASGSAPSNRITQAVYEIGSSAKLMTIAMALDAGKASLADRIDGRELHYGAFTIHDWLPERRTLTLPEAMIYNSNIAAARLAQRVGTSGQKAFFEKMGQFNSLDIDGIDKVAPISSNNWPGIYTITASFGNGMAVSPLQAGMAIAAMANGGILSRPTILKQSGKLFDAADQRVVSSDTSAKMRYLLRRNVEEGSGRKADVAGYFVGGATSTSEKVVNEQYDHDRVLTTFTAVFPADKPKYLVMTLLDEPQRLRETFGFNTAGWNAAPVAAKVIERTAPILGVERRAAPPADRTRM